MRKNNRKSGIVYRFPSTIKFFKNRVEDPAFQRYNLIIIILIKSREDP